MQNTIDKQVCDTNIAELLAEFSYNLNTSADYYNEKLYRSVTGEWFLCVTAAHKSIYAEIVKAEKTLTTVTIACSDEKAIAILIKCDCKAVLDTYFPDSYQVNPFWPIGDGDYLLPI